jgi:hypothetical protein
VYWKKQQQDDLAVILYIKSLPVNAAGCLLELNMSLYLFQDLLWCRFGGFSCFKDTGSSGVMIFFTG